MPPAAAANFPQFSAEHCRTPAIAAPKPAHCAKQSLREFLTRACLAQGRQPVESGPAVCLPPCGFPFWPSAWLQRAKRRAWHDKRGPCGCKREEAMAGPEPCKGARNKQQKSSKAWQQEKERYKREQGGIARGPPPHSSEGMGRTPVEASTPPAHGRDVYCGCCHCGNWRMLAMGTCAAGGTRGQG